MSVFSRLIMAFFRRNIMKRLMVILMVLVLAAASFAACAGNNSNDSPTDSGKPDIATGDWNGDSDSGTDEPEPAQSGESAEEFLRTITEETATAKGVCGADLTWYYKEGVLVIKGTGDMTHYYVDAYEYYYAPWVTYNDGEIKNEISQVIVDDGVTSVGSLAFYGLDLLSKVVLPDSLEKIEEGAFFYCGSLTSVDFPDSLEVIGDEAFSHCGKLASVSFPESLRVIGTKAFYGCLNLTSIAIPAAVEEIGRDAFADCNNADVTLPEGLTQVDIEYAFDFTKSITIPASATKIDGLGQQHSVTFLGDAPEISIHEVKNDSGEIIGKAIKGLIDGLDYETGEPCETGVTIYYSGSGFEKYIEMFPQYKWVKK